MSREQDKLTPRQRFSRLVNADLDRRMKERDWTVSKFIDESGVGRATIYEWLKDDSDRMPKPEKVKRYAVRLGEPYGPYATALGWSSNPNDSAPHQDLEGFIRRAKAMAQHPKTTEERRSELQERIDDAEASLRMLRVSERLLREALSEGQPEP